jgi:glutamine amidotransferase
MDRLMASALIPVPTERVLVDKTPTLGICLGMQLMTRGSDEGSCPARLDNATTRRFDER